MCELTNPLEPTIFHEDWWLEIASGGRYEVSEVKSGGKTVGRLPYFIQSRYGIRSSEMPMLTHFLGPGLVEGEGSANNRFLKKLAITRELIQKMPKVPLINMKLHSGITDAVAFQEQGFRTSVQFTHEIEPSSIETLWSNLRNKTRNVIRRSQEQVNVSDLMDSKRFMEFYERNLRERGQRNFLDQELCRRLIDTAIERQRGRIIAAFDSSTKTLLSANFYIWDSSAYYFLLTSRSLNSGNGVTSLLVWEGMKDASRRKIIFDCDGLNSNGGILFFAGLGGTVKPRYIASKANFKGQLLKISREIVWGKNYFVRG